jgi:hypothetical protein
VLKLLRLGTAERRYLSLIRQVETGTAGSHSRSFDHRP